MVMTKSNRSDVRVMDGGFVLRELDEKKRTADFVAATENGVMTYYGREYLRVSGVRLDRYKKNPVVLDSHNRFNAEDIVGRASVRREGRELVARITFAETPRAETIWQLVKGGFLRTTSVGFLRNPQKTIQLEDGQSDGKGDGKIEGPAVVVKEWELLEISVVPVPADQDAVRRSLMEGVEPMADKAKQQEAAPAGGGAGQPDPKEQEQAQVNVEPTEEEIATRNLKARNDAIRSICPDGLEKVAERAIVEGLDVDAARKLFLEQLTKKQTPAGHVEPEEPEGGRREQATAKAGDGQTQETQRKIDEIDDDVLLRSLKR